MPAKLSSFEILTMAEQIERDGAEFYQKAAQKLNDDELQNLFFQLAEWEKRHEQIFAEMKKQLLEKHDTSMRFDEANYITSNPQQLFSLAKSAIHDDPEEQLSKIHNKLEALKLVLARENETVKFFRSLESHLRDLVAKKKVREVIEEEKKHINIITQAIEQIT